MLQIRHERDDLIVSGTAGVGSPRVSPPSSRSLHVESRRPPHLARRPSSKTTGGSWISRATARRCRSTPRPACASTSRGTSTCRLCSTTPWQMHGVIDKLARDGYDVRQRPDRGAERHGRGELPRGHGQEPPGAGARALQGPNPVPERAADRVGALRAQGQAARARPRLREAGHPDPEDADGEERRSTCRR